MGGERRAVQSGADGHGTVRSVEEYGVFVELMPNLCGLAELRETEPRPASTARGAYIKSIIPERMKIKLIIIDTAAQIETRPPLRYFVYPTAHRISRNGDIPRMLPPPDRNPLRGGRGNGGNGRRNLFEKRFLKPPKTF